MMILPLLDSSSSSDARSSEEIEHHVDTVKSAPGISIEVDVQSETPFSEGLVQDSGSSILPRSLSVSSQSHFPSHGFTSVLGEEHPSQSNSSNESVHGTELNVVDISEIGGSGPPGLGSSQNRDSQPQQNQQPRRSPLNSCAWISIECVVLLLQVAASVAVLLLSTKENPKVPLRLWILGYACGCIMLLPLLLWRFSNRHGRAGGTSAPSQPAPDASHERSRPEELEIITDVSEVREGVSSPHAAGLPPPRQPLARRASRARRISNQRLLQRIVNDPRTTAFVDFYRVAMDWFFAVWFVMGNVWVFGGEVSAKDAPSLYNLSILFLAFSCVSYALPFLLCAMFCCCLPCIIAVMGSEEGELGPHGKGADAESIHALPTVVYKVREVDEPKKDHTGLAGESRIVNIGDKAAGGEMADKGDVAEEEVSDTDSVRDGEVGLLWAGTDKEQLVAVEDAVCCICLGRYRDGVELRQLPCNHHFHVQCVDTWLKLNSCCPLCKENICRPAAGSGV